ncbi:hypothetical protein Esti_005400 [Eimeria stiedai]
MLEAVRCSSFFAEGSGQHGAPDASTSSAGDSAEPAAHAVDLIQSSFIFLWNEEVERLDPFLLHLEEQAEMSRRCRATELASGVSADIASDDSFEQKSSHRLMAPAPSAKVGLDGSKTRTSNELLTTEAASPAPATASCLITSTLSFRRTAAMQMQKGEARPRLLLEF